MPRGPEDLGFLLPVSGRRHGALSMADTLNSATYPNTWGLQ